MSMIADKIGIKKPSLYKHFSSKDEIVEAMYQFLREQSKKNANIKPVDFSQLFQGKTAYEVLQGVVQGYVNMNHQEKLLTFYTVIYSERSIQPMAARIVAEETERMIIATKQLFYAMEIHKLLHFENADMSATNAPSLRLWNQFSSLYNICTLICAMMVCAGIQGKGSRLLRTGIYLFTAMEWISAVGFSVFPLSDSGYAGTFQDKMHILSTILVVLLSIVSLVILIIAGVKRKEYRSFGVFAGIALGMMLVGALGMNIVPKEYFGVVERFSVFAAVGYNAVLGVELFRMDLG